MSEGVIGDDMAVNLEFLQGHSRIAPRGEEKHIPVFVAHGEDGNGCERFKTFEARWDVRIKM